MTIIELMDTLYRTLETKFHQTHWSVTRESPSPNQLNVLEVIRVIQSEFSDKPTLEVVAYNDRDTVQVSFVTESSAINLKPKEALKVISHYTASMGHRSWKNRFFDLDKSIESLCYLVAAVIACLLLVPSTTVIFILSPIVLPALLILCCFKYLRKP